MEPVFSKDELIDLLMEFKEQKYPDNPLTREQADSYVENVKPDNKIVYSDAGKSNIVVEAVLTKLALSVISGLIIAGVKAGSKAAWDAWVRRPAPEIAKDMHPPNKPDEYKIYLNTIIFMQGD